MQLFKKKIKDEKVEELKKELKKYPRKKRKHLLELYNQFEKGRFLRINEDIDNKQLILEKI